MAALETEAPKTLTERVKAANAVMGGLDKELGKRVTIFNMGERKVIQWPSRPTGILSLDQDVLGIGGLPQGRIVEIYGPESGGKTTLSLQVIAEAQKRGELAAYVDVEQALDPMWAQRNGVNLKHLWLTQPDTGEDALSIVEEFLNSKAFGVVVVDSVAALVPKAELEGDFGDAQMGLQARLMSQAMRKLTQAVTKSNTTLIFINQIRDKIGVMFGSPETTTGGRALKFYSSVRLDIRRISAIKIGDAVVGNLVRIKTAKNKLYAPFKETEVELLFNLPGFNKMGSILDMGVKYNVIEKAGAWYSIKSGERFQGRDAFCEAFGAKECATSLAKLIESIEKARKEENERTAAA